MPPVLDLAPAGFEQLVQVPKASIAQRAPPPPTPEQTKAVTKLQSKWRGRTVRRWFLIRRLAVVRLQSQWRGKTAREELYWDLSIGYGSIYDDEEADSVAPSPRDGGEVVKAADDPNSFTSQARDNALTSSLAKSGLADA